MNIPGPLHRIRESARPSLWPAWIPVLLWSVLPFEGGCGNAPLAGPSPDDDRPTLPSTVVTDESQDADGPVAPGEAEAPGAGLSILARPVFCCNPLAVDFEAVAEDSSWLEEASFSWSFGDGRTRGGPSPTHAYATPGVYVVSLAVEGADGHHLEAKAVLELAQGEGGDVSLVAWEDGADNGPTVPEDDPAFTDESTVQPAEENSAPIAQDRIVTTGAGTAVVFQLTATDADGDDLTFTVVTAPEHGSLGPVSGVMAGFATVVYEPDAEFAGIDTLLYEADDGTASSNPATVTIEVEAGPGRPEVGDRVRATFVGEPVTLTLRGTDPDDDALLFSIVSGPVFGDLGPIEHVAPDRAEVTYFPDVGFEGEDSFSFAASNGRADSASATFTVVVTKRFVPWVEISGRPSDNVWNGEQQDPGPFSTAQGAVEGMTRAEFYRNGIAQWSLLTDTVVLSVCVGVSGQEEALAEWYEALNIDRPAHVSVVGGITTNPILAGAEDYLVDADRWEHLADLVVEVAELTGVNQVVLENESATNGVFSNGYPDGFVSCDEEDPPEGCALCEPEDRLCRFREAVLAVDPDYCDSEDTPAIRRVKIHPDPEHEDYPADACLVNSLAAFHERISPHGLANGGIQIWWHRPRVSQNTDWYRICDLDLNEISKDFVGAVEEELNRESMYLTAYTVWPGWRVTDPSDADYARAWLARQSRAEHAALMAADGTGYERMLERLFVAHDGLWHYADHTRAIYTPKEALAEMRELASPSVCFYMTSGEWIRTAESFLDELNPNEEGWSMQAP